MSAQSPLSAAEAALAEGEAHRRAGHLAEAAAAFDAAVAGLNARTVPGRRAHALSRRARVARDEGDLSAALAFHSEAVALARSDGPTGQRAHLLRHQGDILSEAGRHAEAAPVYAEAMALYRADSATDPLDLANAVRSQAVHAEAMGIRSEARALWTEAAERYAALTVVIETLSGQPGNPGVVEARARLAALADPPATA
ncbi:hypothetical protein BZG35_08470 [Brevundimonas sp. LM2]|uniref:tetratricopeptide repeat protein n=1 Tax=Brevundimonas sp. LM2 TaxID=1938605 RepID=UPI00098404F4|nr:tetratricopeptide repeat protein [Brevundimonas sp. LM2]AQR61681.1 hypothetical protein BZG35_08470 [Brevundimonas sp. LM2]